MGKVIRLPLLSREARSDDSESPSRGLPLPDRPPRLRPALPQAERVRAVSISPIGRKGPRPHGTSPRPIPRSKTHPRSRLCLESLASCDSIMDDKSMQQWIDSQLTAGGLPRRMVSVGRPKDTVSPSTYNSQFIKRVRAARELYTAEPKEMARALGVREDTYYRYEKRTMLPHHLIQPFCELTGVSVDWLINGPKPKETRQPLEKTA